MKKFLNTILAAVTISSVAISLNSCSDALDIVQPGELEAETLFVSVANMQEVLIGSVYGQMEPADEIYFTAVFTDEVKPGSGSGGQEQDLHRYFLDPSSPVVSGGTVSTVTSNGIWLNNYRVINRVNRLLEGAKSVTPANAAEQAQYNNILAQARAIRAYCYVQLEAYFSTNMKDPNALGVILFKDVPETYAKLPRSTNQEVYNFINEDLDYARGILTNPTSSTSRFYADKVFVNALSARFNLYRGNNTLAKQYAQDVIAASTVAGINLTPATPIYPPGVTPQPTIGSAAWNTPFYATASSFNPYRNIWNDSSRGEILFSLNRLPTGVGASIGVRWNTNQSTLTGVPMWFLGRNLFNLINAGGDIRRYAYVDPTSVIDPNYLNIDSRNDRIIIDKYPGKTSAATRNDIKVFRLSEMYFILAEAEVAAGNLATAQGLIQQVRVARNYLGTATTPLYTSTQFAYADILKERRLELALEGHRYLDLKRLATQAGVTMDRNIKDDFVTVSNLPNNDYRYTLPIPISERTANPNAQQNPGY